MLAPLVFALALDATPATLAAPPYRTVVFKVAFARRQELTTETYGGLVSQPAASNTSGGYGGSGPVMPSIYEPAPSAKTAMTLDDGTLKVEFFNVRDGPVLVRITENLRSHSGPSVFTAYVTPEGVPLFNGQDFSVLERLTLPFFGRAFGGGRSFSPGTRFDLDIHTEAANVISLFTVTGVAGSAVLLDELQTVRLTAARGMDLVTRGKVRYDPSQQAPLSGDFEERASRSTAESTNQIVSSVHFERISDSING